MIERRSGINESTFTDLTMDILDYADRINDIFSRIDDNFNLISQCYNSNGCNYFLARYDELKRKYSIIHSNIVSYSEDLTYALQHMQEMDTYFAKKFEVFTNETSKKAKEIETL